MRARWLAAAAVAAVTAAVAGVAATSSTNKATRTLCPRQPVALVDAGPTTTVEIGQALRRQIPHVFAHFTSQGERAWPHFQVEAIVILNQLPLGGGLGPKLPALNRYVNTASRRCGKRVAEASALALLQFPECQIPCSFGYAYVTGTRRGWRVWSPDAP